jgi:hypothetical protein
VAGPRPPAGHRIRIVFRATATGLADELIREDLEKLPPRKVSEIPLDVTVQFLAGAYMSVLGWWVDSGTKHTPEEMDRMFRALATGGVATGIHGVTGANRRVTHGGE